MLANRKLETEDYALNTTWNSKSIDDNSALRARYLRAKTLAVGSAAAWIFSLLLLGVSELFNLTLLATSAISVLVFLTAVSVARHSWNKESRFWGSNANCETESECQNQACGKDNGTCESRLAVEINSQIMNLELQGLSLLLRRKYNYDLFFFAGWAIMSAFIAIKTRRTGDDIASIVLLSASISVLIARVILSRIVFAQH